MEEATTTSFNARDIPSVTRTAQRDTQSLQNSPPPPIEERRGSYRNVSNAVKREIWEFHKRSLIMLVIMTSFNIIMYLIDWSMDYTGTFWQAVLWDFLASLAFLTYGTTLLTIVHEAYLLVRAWQNGYYITT